MYQSFKGGLGGIALAKHGRSRAINAENPHGEKGKGGMAASHLGPSRKGSPCLNEDVFKRQYLFSALAVQAVRRKIRRQNRENL